MGNEIKVSVGDVFKMVHADGTSAAFSDCVVVRVYGDRGDTYVDLARPYVTSGSLQAGVEQIDRVPLERLSGPFWEAVRR